MYKIDWDTGQNFFTSSKSLGVANAKNFDIAKGAANFDIPSKSLGIANAKNFDIAKGANWWNKSTGLTAAQGWNLGSTLALGAAKIFSKATEGKKAPAQDLSWIHAAVPDAGFVDESVV